MYKTCNDNFIFYLTHTKYFDILCFFVILLSITLIILIKNDKIFNNSKTWTKIFIIASSGLFVAFLVFLFAGLVASTSFNGCTSKYEGNWETKINNAINTENNILKQNKIIVVGDSRMEFIDDDKDIIKPVNLEFIALSGSAITWLKNTALPKLKESLKEEGYTYHVLFNMGVNDINGVNKNYTEEDMANDYIEIYKTLIDGYPDVRFYFLSVNPIDENVIKSHFPGKRTNKRIENFNKVIKNNIKNLKNSSYCDSYDEMKFEIPDGLHYSQKTNKKIVNYIVNKCIKFKTSTTK